MNGYEVASIVACTRNKEKVATITKLHTPNGEERDLPDAWFDMSTRSKYSLSLP